MTCHLRHPKKEKQTLTMMTGGLRHRQHVIARDMTMMIGSLRHHGVKLDRDEMTTHHLRHREQVGINVMMAMTTIADLHLRHHLHVHVAESARDLRDLRVMCLRHHYHVTDLKNLRVLMTTTTKDHPRHHRHVSRDQKRQLATMTIVTMIGDLHLLRHHLLREIRELRDHREIMMIEMMTPVLYPLRHRSLTRVASDPK